MEPSLEPVLSLSMLRNGTLCGTPSRFLRKHKRSCNENGTIQHVLDDNFISFLPLNLSLGLRLQDATVQCHYETLQTTADHERMLHWSSPPCLLSFQVLFYTHFSSIYLNSSKRDCKVFGVTI